MKAIAVEDAYQFMAETNPEKFLVSWSVLFLPIFEKLEVAFILLYATISFFILDYYYYLCFLISVVQQIGSSKRNGKTCFQTRIATRKKYYNIDVISHNSFSRVDGVHTINMSYKKHHIKIP